METIINYLQSMFITFGIIFSLLPNLLGTAKPVWSPENEDVRLNCAVVSDTHTDGNIFRDRNDKLRRVYADISACSEKPDVLLNIGDFTNSGTAMDYRSAVKLDNYLKVKNTVVCMGNHDSWNGSDTLDYDTALANFTRYLSRKGITTRTAYYKTVIDGYYFICLATEGCDHDEILPVYSAEQLAWFDDTLTQAEQSGLPVFVLTHQPVAGKNGIGSSVLPDSINEILLSHADYSEPILCFSGHCHTFSRNIIDSDGNIFHINMPSTQYNDENGDDEAGGLGLTMEVCENRIVLRVRNFLTEKFIDGRRFEIPC